VLGIFLLTTASKPALGPIQPRMQWVPRALSLGVKRPWRKDDYSPPTSTKVKNARSYNSTPPIRLHGIDAQKKGSTVMTLPYLYHHNSVSSTANLMDSIFFYFLQDLKFSWRCNPEGLDLSGLFFCRGLTGEHLKL